MMEQSLGTPLVNYYNFCYNVDAETYIDHHDRTVV